MQPFVPSRAAIIGGDNRRHALEALRQVFPHIDFEWIPTRESDASAKRFETVIARREIDLIILLKGLLRHQHTRAIRELCKRHGKRLFWFHRSVNPAQLLARLRGSDRRNKGGRA